MMEAYCPKGEVLVREVQQGPQQAIGQFVVVENADFQLPLLGHDWLGKLRLNWQDLFQSCKPEWGSKG